MNEAPKSAGKPGADPGSIADLRALPKSEPASENSPVNSGSQFLAIARASHLRQALQFGLAVAAGAWAAGRPPAQIAVAGCGVLLTQIVLGLHNEVTDADSDAAANQAGHPIAAGRLPRSNASFVAICLAVLSIPLALQNGTIAGAALLLTVLLGVGSNLLWRRTWLSWAPWMLTFALYVVFLSYGGWGLGVHGGPPTWQVTAAAGVLGLGVHFMTALPHLVGDNKVGRRHLPLRIALRIGAPKLLVAAGLVTTLAALAVVGCGWRYGLIA